MKFVFVLLAWVGLSWVGQAIAQDLIVPMGSTYTVVSDESYDNATVSGKLVIETGATLGIGGSMLIDNDALGVVLMSSSNLVVGRKLQVGNNSSLLINKDAKVISGGDLLVLAATLTNYGILEAKDDVDMVSVTNYTMDNEAWFYLTGAADQTVKSNVRIYSNINLEGNTKKVFLGSGPHHIVASLNLNDCKLILEDTLEIDSSTPLAIQRTSGYVIAPAVKWYVDNVIAGNTFLFPVGGNAGIRAVQIKSNGGGFGFITVAYNSGAANNLSSTINGVGGLNTGFYHRIFKEGADQNVDIAIYYEDKPSNDFNRVATWSTTALSWTPFNGSLAVKSMPPNFLGTTARNVDLADFDGGNPGKNAYVLGKVMESNVVSLGYAVLSRDLDGGFSTAKNGKIRFVFEEEYAVNSLAFLEYTLYNSYNLVKEVGSPNRLKVKRGINKYEMNVSSLDTEYGVLEVRNSKGEKWFLRIKKNSI